MLTFSQIIDFIKKKDRLKNNKIVAKTLQIDYQTFCNYKSKNRVPLNKLIDYCERTGTSLDKLLLNRGSPQLAETDTNEIMKLIEEHPEQADYLRGMLDQVAEDAAPYNSEDPDLSDIAEIVEILLDHPEQMQYILGVLHGRTSLVSEVKKIKGLDKAVKEVEKIKANKTRPGAVG